MSQQFIGNFQYQNPREHSKSESQLNESTSTFDHEPHESEFNVLRDERDKLRTDKEQLSKEIGFLRHELDTKREELNNVYTLLEQERGRTVVKIDEQEEAELIKKQKKDFDEIKKKLSEFEAKEAESMKKYSMLESQNEKLRKLLEEFENNRTRIQSDVEGYKTQIADLERSLSDFKEKVAEIKTNSPQKEESPRVDSHLKEELEMERTEKSKLETQLKAKIYELEQAHETIQEMKKQTSSDQIEENDYKIKFAILSEQYEKEIEELRKANYHLTSTLKEKDQSLHDARGKIIEMEDTCSQISASLHHFKTQHERKPEDREIISQLTASVKEKELAVWDCHRQINELKENLSVSKKREEELENELVELDKKYESSQKKYERLEMKFEEQTKEMWDANDKANQAAQLEKEIDDLKFQLAEKDKEFTKFKKRFSSNLEKTQSDHSSTSEKISDELEEKKVLLSQLESDLKTGENKLRNQIRSIKRQRSFSVTLFITVIMSVLIAGGFFAFNKTYCLKKC